MAGMEFGTTNSVWHYWTSGEVLSSVAQTANLSLNTVWTTWVSVNGTTTNLTSTSASTAPVWKIWNGNLITQAIQYATAPPTPEQIAQREIQRQTREREYAQTKQKQVDADLKADALLHEFLDAMQRDQVVKDSAFIVEAKSGRRYQVKRNSRVAELDEHGKIVAYHCIHPRDYFPAGDVMLAQKLMLDTDESEFLRIANCFPVEAR